MNESAFWFEAAKPSRWERINVSLGRRGRIRMLLLGLFLIPTVAFAGAFAITRQLKSLVSASEGVTGAWETVSPAIDCVVTGPGAISFCGSTGGPDDEIGFTATGLTDASSILVSATWNSTTGVATQGCLGSPGAAYYTISSAQEATSIAADSSLAFEIEWVFDTIGPSIVGDSTLTPLAFDFFTGSCP